MRYEATLNVNGIAYPVEIEPGRNLLSVLRDEVGLTGAKEGCDDSECGACMVLLDGQPVNSCSYLALQADGREIVTIEGLAGADGELHPLQRAFLDQGGVQCGFCTPGMLISAKALLDRNPQPERGGDPAGALGQPLPLHRLLGDRAGGAGGRAGTRAMTAAAALATVLLAAAALLIPSTGGQAQQVQHQGHAPTHVAGPYGLSPARDVWGQYELGN